MGGRLVALLLVLSSATGRVWERCELAAELLRLGAAKGDLSTWVCIAERESGLNTSAVGNLNADGSGDHGLFQISDRYWCSPQGWACNLPCGLLEDDDIADDWKCVRRIFRTHGFGAWAVYGPHCSGDTAPYLEGCFGGEPPPTTTEKTPPTTTEKTPPPPPEEVESHSAREGNNAEKSQVVDLEMMEKSDRQRAGRRWKPWTWQF